ncbi:MAG: TonB-dependent receptor plug domain-containing protein [Flavobacteriales bacterium]|nr:TonB-dependent receptor plug domain-containing protein [Flavobacteriales bacterium]
MKLKTLFALSLMAVSAVVFAQNRTLTGTVKFGDAPIKGVKVAVQGTKKVAYTDAEGKYSVELGPKELNVIVAGDGVVSQYIKVGKKQTVLDVTLQFSDMDKAIAKGLIDQHTATTAKATMRADEVTGYKSIKSIVESKSPGVIYEDGYVFFRGNRCNLYLVDGTRVDNLESANLDPNMIDKVEVIKDGTASLYGGGSENGVILVTTKK